MNEYVKMLYDGISGKLVPDNPFETAKSTEGLSYFFKWFLEQNEEEKYNELVNLYYSGQENAFAVGFRTAVKLLMNL